MAIITLSGRVALAAALKAKPLHIAWGTGVPAWDNAMVPESTDTTALVAEVGRRTILIAQYCVPDAAGSIALPGSRFSVALVPTNFLYLRATFEFEDAATDAIREVAIFSDTELVSGLPPGQMYFTPNQIASPGLLLAVERFPSITRSSSVRQSFDFVLNI